MAKKTKVQIDIEVNGKMQKATVAAKDLRKALDGIDKSNKKAAKSAGTLDRNMKGASAASANMTKNFSKMAQGGGGIAAIYAQIAAQVFAVSAAFQFLKSSADTSKLIKGQEALGAVTGTAFKSLTADIQKATGGQLAYAEAAQAAAIGSAAGLSASQLEGLGKAARNASAALGRDLTDSFNRLVRGVTKAEPELLDELGIILRLKDATEEYALSVGKNVEQLSTYERSQAVTNNVLGQAEDKFGKIAKIMDPGAEALNRFLTSFDELLISIKTGVIDSLRPVFDFLANNTNSLVTVFAALSALIVKSLIPNFGQYAKAAGGASFAIKRELVAQRKELERLAEAARVAALSQKELAAESVAAFVGATGASGTAGGKSGLDFLTGASDNASAQANAKRLLDNAEKQSTAILQGELEARTGAFAEYTDDQIEMANKAYHHRVASLGKEEDATAASTAAQGRSYDMLYLKAKLEATKFGAWLLKWGARLASGLQLVLIVGAFAGAFVAIATILYDLGKAIFNYLSPAKEGTQEAIKATDDYVSSLQRVNEELVRMAQVRRDVGLSVTESITQSGGAAQSADLAGRATGLLAAKQANQAGLIDDEEYSKAQKAFKLTLENTDKLIPGLAKTQQAFLNSLDPMDLNIDKLNELSQAAINAKVAQENLARNQDQLRQQMRNFTGGKVDPVQGMITTASSIVSDRKTQIAAANEERNKNNVADFAALQAARAQLEKDKNTDANRFTGDGIFAGGTATRQQRKADAIAASEKKIAELQKRIANSNAGVQALRDELAKEEKQLASLTKFQKEYNKNVAKAQGIREKVATQTRLEFDIEDKIFNLGLKKDSLQTSELDMANKVAMAKYQMENASDDEKENLTTIYNNLVSQQTVLKGNNDLKRAELDLQTRIAQIQADHGIEELMTKEKNLQLESQALNMLDKQAAAQKTINSIEQERIKRNASNAMTDAKLGSALPGFVFDEEGKAERARIDTETQINQLKLEQIERDKTMATAKLELEKAQFAVAQQRLAMELAVLNEKRGIKNVDDEGLTSEQARLLGEIETNANSAFAAAGTAIDETYKAAGEAIAASNRELLLAEVKLTNVGQISETVGQSLEDNLTGAFASLIDGSKNFKDAFADMAKAVIGDIAKIIAKQLALKAISSFGFGFAEGGVAPGGFQAFANGGIAKGGFQKYANGGVVRRPTLGLVGEGKYDEAIVPLPNGNSIPVDMRGGGSQQNNVTVNVAIEGNGRASKDSQSDSKQGAELGSMIATVVQKELQNQKRAGGLLNPMGAS